MTTTVSYAPYETPQLTAVPEVFQEKTPEGGGSWLYPYVGTLSTARQREFLPELIARAYLHMQELGWTPGHEWKLWIGTHKERPNRWRKAIEVKDYLITTAIGVYVAEPFPIVFTKDMELYRETWRGSPSGHMERTPFFKLDPLKLDDRALQCVFDALCQILNLTPEASA